MEISPYLRLMVQRDGSDLYFSSGACPHIRIKGHTVAIGEKKLSSADVSGLAFSIMNGIRRRMSSRS